TWVAFTLILIFTSFGVSAKELKAGPWKFVLKTANADIPFIIEFSFKNKKLLGVLKNGQEKILLDEISYNKGSISIPLQSYELSLELKQQNDKLLTGFLVRHNKNP